MGRKTKAFLLQHIGCNASEKRNEIRFTYLHPHGDEHFRGSFIQYDEIVKNDPKQEIRNWYLESEYLGNASVDNFKTEHPVFYNLLNDEVIQESFTISVVGVRYMFPDKETALAAAKRIVCENSRYIDFPKTLAFSPLLIKFEVIPNSISVNYKVRPLVGMQEEMEGDVRFFISFLANISLKRKLKKYSMDDPCKIWRLTGKYNFAFLKFLADNPKKIYLNAKLKFATRMPQSIEDGVALFRRELPFILQHGDNALLVSIARECGNAKVLDAFSKIPEVEPYVFSSYEESDDGFYLFLNLVGGLRWTHDIIYALHKALDEFLVIEKNSEGIYVVRALPDRTRFVTARCPSLEEIGQKYKKGLRDEAYLEAVKKFEQNLKLSKDILKKLIAFFEQYWQKKNRFKLLAKMAVDQIVKDPLSFATIEAEEIRNFAKNILNGIIYGGSSKISVADFISKYNWD